jgi:hypothetical protein
VKDKGKENYVWRMHNPRQTSRRHKLFLSKNTLSVQTERKISDSETTVGTGQSSNAALPPALGSTMRLKANTPTTVRGGKTTVPKLGVMTTVQEASMDSREFQLIHDEKRSVLMKSSHHTWQTSGLWAVYQCTSISPLGGGRFR